MDKFSIIYVLWCLAIFPNVPSPENVLSLRALGVLRCDIVRLGERNQAFELG